MVIPKLEKGMMRKENYRLIPLVNINVKILEVLTNQIKIYKNIIYITKYSLSQKCKVALIFQNQFM